MQVFWNEYGTMILGIAGAASITAAVAGLLLSDGSVYEVILRFAESIC